MFSGDLGGYGWGRSDIRIVIIVANEMKNEVGKLSLDL